MSDRKRSTWRPSSARWAEQLGPRPIGVSLDALATRLGTPTTTAMTAVFGHWDDVVGPSVAAHSRPVSLMRGTLVVEVDDPVWATQLRFLGATIMERLQTLAEGVDIARLEVRVRRG